ncbi:hypothetical protein CF319_g4470 [Tilletia indica]|nr:hypothetical protein CF319_g4470 [Tilletia indica]
MDLRIVQNRNETDIDSWTSSVASQWIQSASMLSKIASAATALENIYVRMSGQGDLLRVLEVLIANSRNLVDVVVQIDTTLRPPPPCPPKLNLSNFVHTTGVYRALRRFSILAPGCELGLTNIGVLVSRFRALQDISIVCQHLQVKGETWQWVPDLLAAAANVKTVELGATYINLQQSDSDPGVIRLPNLNKLTLDIPAVNARLLRLMHAPCLQHLQIQTTGAFNNAGLCSPNHFPRLRLLHIRCKLPVLLRIDVLGLPRIIMKQNYPMFSTEWAQMVDSDAGFTFVLNPNTH